jgi:gamma-glutamylcyclotransferase (GGCT)/AIG2-like uncharacterized protein YtfP
MKHLLFVYGSLQQGEWLHDHWLSDGAEATLFGRDTTAEAVFDIASVPGGTYPYVMNVDNDGWHIGGELYEVSDDVFNSLARMEGNAGYHVETVPLMSGMAAAMFVRPTVPLGARDRTHIHDLPVPRIRGWSTD